MRVTRGSTIEGGTDRPTLEPRRDDHVVVSVTTQPDVDTRRHWDRLITGTAGADVAQLSAWADVRRQAGFTPVFVLAHHSDQLVGGALVLQRRLPGLGGVGYLPYGPVLAIDRATTAEAVARALADLTRRHLRTLFVQPPREAEPISHRLLRLGFRPSTAGIAPATSLELHLAPPSEHLRKGMSSGTRSGIRAAAARGIRVRTGTEHDLPVVAELLAETAAHHHFEPLSLPYLRTLYRHLGPDGHIKIFIADDGGVPVAAQVLTACGGVVKLRLTGMRRSDARSGAPALLQWETILWAKANGYRSFDFGGIAAPSVDEIRAGRANLASRINGRDYFKASFGGQPFRYPPPVELFTSTTARLGYDLARRSELGRNVIRRTQRILRSGRTAR